LSSNFFEPDPLFFIPLPLFFLHPRLIFPLDPVLLGLLSLLLPDPLPLLSLLDLQLIRLYLLPLDLPGLTHLLIYALILRPHYRLYPQPRYLREYYRYYRRPDYREIDPNEAIHLWEALLVEAAETRVTLGVESAVVLVLVAFDLLEDRAGVKGLTLLFRAAASRTLGVKLTKLTLSELESVRLEGELNGEGEEKQESQTKFGNRHFIISL
jgi:hypothetical protein